ncbi:MAG: dehydrogenase, partial [Candidatus Atribacteria bacterium]|nr:dehydrogenase [Candidatus Atribacteria bacterium]
MENWFRNDKGLLRTTYGFDDVSLAPGDVTIDPKDVDVSTTIGGEKLNIPVLGAAMDGVIDSRMAVEMGRLGGWGVLNLEGLFTRYDDPYSLIQEMIQKPREKVTDFIQEIYQAPI